MTIPVLMVVAEDAGSLGTLDVTLPLVADREAAMPVLRAIAHGMIDAYLPAPGAGRDEGFHRGSASCWRNGRTTPLPTARGADHRLKRVASAVGEGSVCIQLVHRVLHE